ncbi:HSP90 family protein [Corallococcus sp. H22C18031201]|uniref:HSP90 family protein n=1 Tax=Citreicoccus inhibens TaxID=2849499 RepID=UPI000E76ABEE|nr:HSP90 family protein [Citreicoccus inhibens]MBU8894380.1 HSP90 family protein [Citreicoccus inhibens]RJS16156.1 HSP90 family protein [Corallococcus sp. H22C18031201]
MDHRFQVSLRGVIDLLSHHLYSSPGVYVRELLQNATDAIRARQHLESQHPGTLRLELMEKQDGGATTLVFTDDGVGLTEEEVHRFLATIGESSKREALEARRNDFIGQFGIGLLSCFMVCDELLVVTRSARGTHPTLEWRGRHDGTYDVRPAAHPLERPGTQVFLTARADMAEWFTPERVRSLVLHYGGLLPFPIHLTVGGQTEHLNRDGAPWSASYESPSERREALLAYGRQVFDMDFLDYIPLRATSGDVQGVAFVLPASPHFNAKQKHRVYLKSMLLSESADNLLPDWAFFVKCVVNANALRPTASRESFYEDAVLERARGSLGVALRRYLMDLAREEPRALQRLIALHGLSMKALALDDDDFFRLVIDWLPFETSLGMMTLGDYRRAYSLVRYTPTLDGFRQVARVAAAQGLCIINAAYTHDTALLERLPQLFPEVRAEPFSSAELPQSFEELTDDERHAVRSLVRVADRALLPFRCGVEVRKFLPAEVPTLYSTDEEGAFRREAERAREGADDLYAGVVAGVLEGAPGQLHAKLCFNYLNPVVRRMARVPDREVMKLSVEMLYVQSLLLGQHPLSAREMTLLNQGLLGLIDARLGDDDEGPENDGGPGSREVH